MKFSLLMGGKRMQDTAFSQAQRQEAVEEAARPSARLCVVRAGALLEPQSPETS
jgi:hypothetical protein